MRDGPRSGVKCCKCAGIYLVELKLQELPDVALFSFMEEFLHSSKEKSMKRFSCGS